MMVQFIFMTIAFVIMLIVAMIQQRTNKRLSKQMEEIEVKGWREVHGFGRLVSTRRRFIVIENAGDNATLNRTVEKYKEEGTSTTARTAPTACWCLLNMKKSKNCELWQKQ